MTRLPAAPTLTRDLGVMPPTGRQYVVTIGIDRYQSRWPALQNAVSDAHGAAAAFGRLGFEPKASLIEEHATRNDLIRVVDDLSTLSPHDSLVVFFAGHGHTDLREFRDGLSARIGYLVPSDAAGLASCVRLDDWLRSLARLPPRHILVILDCCGSGIALAPRYRMGGQSIMNARSPRVGGMDVMAPLRQLRSRRVITSALDTQVAGDSGPISGHSLFTGCLIEALSGELFTRLGRRAIASSELFNHVRAQVWQHSRSQQTPDFGALHCDERGELIFEEPSQAAAPVRKPLRSPSATSGAVRQLSLADFRTPTTRMPLTDARAVVAEMPAPSTASGPSGPRNPPSVSVRSERRVPARVQQLDPAFMATLDRHESERAHGRSVLSIISARSTVATVGWATWAAGYGRLTIPTTALTIADAASDLLSAMPWLRCLPSARAKIAAIVGAAKLDAALHDPALDHASWLDDAAGDDLATQVAAWLLAWSMEPWGGAPELDSAPSHGLALLSAVRQLNPSIAVLFQSAVAETALRTARELLSIMPCLPVAVVAPEGRRPRALRVADPTALRSEVVLLAGAPQHGDNTERLVDRAAAALATDPRTAGRFERDAQVPGHAHAVTVDLLANDASLAVMIDDWYCAADLHRHGEDRIRDSHLQLAGYYVLRVPVGALEHRLDNFVDEVAVILAGRRL